MDVLGPYDVEPTLLKNPMRNSLWSAKAKTLNASDRSQQVKVWESFGIWILAALLKAGENIFPTIS